MMRPFMGGDFRATTQTQLEHILAGADLILSDEVKAEIEKPIKTIPCPFSSLRSS